MTFFSRFLPNNFNTTPVGRGGQGGAIGKLREDVRYAFLLLERAIVDNGEYGFSVRLINKTGAASVKGQLVKASSTVDNAFVETDANCTGPIGAVLDSGVADGELCTVIVSGKAQVLIKDGTSAVRDGWVKTSDVAGRADASAGSPPGADISHWREVGHCIEAKSNGTDVLAWCILHFN